MRDWYGRDQEGLFLLTPPQSSSSVFSVSSWSNWSKLVFSSHAKEATELAARVNFMWVIYAMLSFCFASLSYSWSLFTFRSFRFCANFTRSRNFVPMSALFSSEGT